MGRVGAAGAEEVLQEACCCQVFGHPFHLRRGQRHLRLRRRRARDHTPQMQRRLERTERRRAAPHAGRVAGAHHAEQAAQPLLFGPRPLPVPAPPPPGGAGSPAPPPPNGPPPRPCRPRPPPRPPPRHSRSSRTYPCGSTFASPGTAPSAPIASAASTVTSDPVSTLKPPTSGR